MDQPPSEPETAEPDPFAGIGEPVFVRKPPRASALSIFRKVIAGLLLVAGALIATFGGLMYGESKTGVLELPSFAGSLVFWAGAGVCLFALALFDLRGPFRLFRRKRPR